MNETDINEDLTIVMFGATGDLAKKKLWSALESLVNKDKIASPDIIGFAYSDRTQDHFKDIMHDASSSDWYKSAHYLSGDLDKDDIYHEIAAKLEGKLSGTILFVLAVAPEYFMDVAIGLDKSGLVKKCRDCGHQIRILIEKPFGTDLKSAKKLDQEFCSRFESEELYRIDHYLGKSMLQNLYTLRSANPWFSAGLSDKTVESVEITFLENNDASDRGAFYDATGAWRDVGQNHLLQLLAAAMTPVTGDMGLTDDSQLPELRAVFLKSLTCIDGSGNWQRGQYQSYRKTNKINENSETETYFKVGLQSDLADWQQTFITLTSGKATGKSLVTVVYNLKSTNKGDKPARLIFSSNPTEKAVIELWGQDDDHGDELEKHAFTFSYNNPKTDAYERVFLSAIQGDSTWFVSSSEVKAQWRLADEVYKQLQTLPLEIYPDSTLLE